MMRLFQGCFFIIRPTFSLKCVWFIRRQHWVDWFLPFTLIRWVIRKCFQQVIRGRGIRKNIDIIVCRMDTFLFLCVLHCGFWSLLMFRNFFLLINISVNFRFLFCSSPSSCAFLIFSFSIQASSWRWRYSSLSWFLLILSLLRNKSSNPCLDYFIMRKSEEACGCLFLSAWDQRAS